MKLDHYLAQPDALSVAELCRRINVKQPAQVRQWRHGYGGRLPSAQNCVAIERATNGAVRRWDLRPDDWHLIWPELVGTDGAPAVAAVQEVA